MPDNKIKVCFLRGGEITELHLANINAKMLRKPPSQIAVEDNLLGTTSVKKAWGLLCFG